jgi:hypothetical protein
MPEMDLMSVMLIYYLTIYYLRIMYYLVIGIFTHPPLRERDRLFNLLTF